MMRGARLEWEEMERRRPNNDAERGGSVSAKTEARSSREIFGLPDPLRGIIETIDDRDEVTLFFQLMLHHDFYKHRYDLLRKYRPALLEPATARGVASEGPPPRWRLSFVNPGADLKGVIPSGTAADAWSVIIAVALFRRAAELPGADPEAPIDPRMIGFALQQVLEGVGMFANEQMELCEREWERAIENRWLGRLRVPRTSGGTLEVPYVRSLDPKANPGILGKFLWKRGAEGGLPAMAIIQRTVGNRTVVCVDPDSCYNLKGLAVRLQELETERLAAQGTPDERPSRFRYVDRDGLERVDPLFRSSDPWYDGRAHGYTIVDTPGCGTSLSPDEVFAVIVGEDWAARAGDYETEAYRKWLEGQCQASVS